MFKLGACWTYHIWLRKLLQNQLGQQVGRSTLWILTDQCGQLAGVLRFGYVADWQWRRKAYTAYSLLTAAAVYGLAFHWQEMLTRPLWFWSVMFAMGVGSGCTAGFGARLAEFFPPHVCNFAMGTSDNGARGIQSLAPALVSFFVSLAGVRGGLSVPMVLALATAAWVWVLPETKHRDLARVGPQ